MRFICKLKESLRIKKILYFSVIVFLFVYLFCVPMFGESKTITRYIIYIAMFCLTGVSFGFCFLFDNLKLNKTAFLLPVFCVFALFGTVTYSLEFRLWVTIILLTISFFTFVYAFKALKNKFLIISIISIAFFAFSVFYIFHYRHEIIDYRSYTNDSFRLGWDFDNPNGVSTYSVIGMATSLYIVLFWNKKFRFLFIPMILTSLLVGLTTGSRTFLIIVLVMNLVFLYFKLQKHKYIFLIVLIGTIGLGILLINLPFFATLKDRLLKAVQTLFGTAYKVDTSTLERVVMIDYGFYLGSKKLIFGYGVNGFAKASGIGTYAHSNYAEVLCDFGLVGFLLFYAPLVVLLINTFTKKKVDKSFVITFTLYYFIVSFSNVFYYKKIYYLGIALLFYFVFIESQELKKNLIVEDLNRLVFVCDTMGSGGAEKVISSLANEMASLNIDVTIIGVADFFEGKSFYKLNTGVKYLTFKNHCKRRITSIKRLFLLRKTLKTMNPDVVVAFLPNAIIYTWLSLIGLGIPFVVSERNNPYIDPKKKLMRLLKKFSFIKANGSVFQTKDAMNFYPNIVRKKATIIKNPIVLNAVPKELTLRKKTVLAVGRFTEQKNYKCLLDAFNIFNKEMNKEYKLNIYGEGPLKEKYKGYCNSIGILEYVNFMGNDTDWQSKESEDSMYVLSSDYEGMPNSLAEAMALGIPSVSTDCPTGGSRELINDGINGYIVSTNNPQALADKMILIANQSPKKFYDENINLKDILSIHNITLTWISFIKGLSKEAYE